MPRTIALVLLSALMASPCFAQGRIPIENCARYRELIAEVVAGVPAGNAGGPLDPTINVFDIGQTTRCFVWFVGDRAAFGQFVRRFESSRTDKQSGASAAAAGATSIVAGGPTAKVLSLATEYGALTQSVSGQVVTVRGNLAGLPLALVKQNVFPYCVEGDVRDVLCVRRSVLGVLRRASFSVSFDASRDAQVVSGSSAGSGASTGARPVAFTGRSQEISTASARFEILNQRDAASPKFREAWRGKVGAAMSDAAKDLSDKAGNLAERVMNIPAYSKWQAESIASLRAAGTNREQAIAAIEAALGKLATLARADLPDLNVQAADAMASYSKFFAAEDGLIDDLATKNVLAVEYTHNRPTGQPATSNFRGILDLPITPQVKLVANAAVTLYNADPPEGTDSSRYRDAQAGAQVDYGLRDTSILGPATLSLGAYYQYQHSAVLLTIDPAKPLPNITFTDLPAGAKTVFAKTGSIVLVQAKLTTTPTGSSVKIPFAVTYSNRTELIDKPAWRAQVGVSYDFDALLSALGRR